MTAPTSRRRRITSAPYAGFGAYYTIPDLSVTDLSSQFIAFDDKTLEIAPPFPDTPQAGYYFIYTDSEVSGPTS